MSVYSQRILFSPFCFKPTKPNPSFYTTIDPISAYKRFFCFSIPPSPTCSEELCSEPNKWQPFRKKKVVMRVGYVGSNYRGLQMQRDEHSLTTIEEELENAIYKAGGILESNFGNLNKIAWARSSRTDKGVHSLATTITLKMEIPDFAWKGDPYGVDLADHINFHLPANIKVFSILPSKRSFDPRRECDIRKYSYLLPAEIIGIKNKHNTMEIGHHISDFNEILRTFEGEHPFHNYTIRSKYRRNLPIRKTRKDCRSSMEEKLSNSTYSKVEESDHQSSSLECSSDEADLGGIGEVYPASSFDESHADSFHDFGHTHTNKGQDSSVVVRAKWLHQPDEKDRVSSSHFRKILQCSCMMPQKLMGLDYVEISVWGQSFMLHQIRKMVGTAIAVKCDIFPRDVLTLSLAKHSRIVLPLAPSEVLVLRGNNYRLGKRHGEVTRPEMVAQIESEVILGNVEKFYESTVLPEIARFLDPLRSPWKGWTEKLELSRIPEPQLDEVRNALRVWEENLAIRKVVSVDF
ncbi:hypothetical protein SAY87_021741 [Trapa incisa]|uniref:tRNA pseudouridine synthase n=1 Tax=Trapa incisa TaxID=236973 RepID=A0AAN7PSK8_9MYRT|nr:hypothetical protein SAY87_021741 [Trapa incisa]